MSAVKKRLYYFWKKLAEKQTRKSIARVHYSEDIAHFEKCTTKKPASQIKQEMNALHRYWDCYPFQYYRFDLYRSDCALSLEQMKQYVPHYFIFNLFYPLSFKNYGILCEDKLLNYALLKAYDTPQPRFLFCFDNNTFFDDTNSPVTSEQVDAILASFTGTKIFIKPRFGIGGKGIFVFSRNADCFVDASNHVLDPAFFNNELKNEAYVVQEGLAQHDAINQIYPHSVNTFRIITECKNGHSQVLFALLRMGMAGHQVDNASLGGVYTSVDAASGRLGGHAFTKNRSRFEAHPDTNFVFKNAVIQQWPQIKRFTEQAALKFREIKYVGWDVALTPDGPVVIEINHHPGINTIQDWYGGIRDDLKINPKDWWYQSNYTIKNV